MIERLLPAVTALTGSAMLWLWIQGPTARLLEPRVPGRDRPAGMEEAEAADPLGDIALRPGDGRVVELPGAWPGFRGAELSMVAVDAPPLARQWPAGGPPQLWSIEVGEGYAGAAVRDGRVYIMDYDRERQEDALRCLSLQDGSELWRLTYPIKIKRNHGMSRTIPTLAGDHVVAMGPMCQVICADALTGEFRWGIDLVREYGTVVPPWYAGQCPLVLDDVVLLGVGGEETLAIAVDLATGELRWKSPNPKAWQMTHASLTPFTFAKRRMVAYNASGGLAGIDVDSGDILWMTDEWKISIATIASPVVVGDGRLFLSGGYNAGSAMLQLIEEGESIVPRIDFRLPPKVFGATQQTPVYYQGHLYGIRPNGELVCLDLSGKILWESGIDYRFGLGPCMIADRLIYALDDHGRLVMVEAVPDGFRPLGDAQVLDGHEAWGPMALAGRRLILRDLTRMVSLDVGKEGGASP